MDLARPLEQLERKYDAQFKVVFEAIRQLMVPPRGEATAHWLSTGNGVTAVDVRR